MEFRLIICTRGVATKYCIVSSVCKNFMYIADNCTHDIYSIHTVCNPHSL